MFEPFLVVTNAVTGAVAFAVWIALAWTKDELGIARIARTEAETKLAAERRRRVRAESALVELTAEDDEDDDETH